MFVRHRPTVYLKHNANKVGLPLTFTDILSQPFGPIGTLLCLLYKVNNELCCISTLF